MTVLDQIDSQLTASAINPLILATREVFETMLACSVKRTSLELKSDSPANPTYEVSAVIGVTGRASGTIVFSASEGTALGIFERMLGFAETSLNASVLDAIGEITNMIAGAAKAKMSELELSIGIPNIVTGREHRIHYPSDLKPICVGFQSDLGPFTIEGAFIRRH